MQSILAAKTLFGDFLHFLDFCNFSLFFFFVPEIWLVKVKKTTKPVSMQFSDYCYYFSFINY